MARKQSRRSISVAGSSYRRFRVYCDGIGDSMSAIIQRHIDDLCDKIRDPGPLAARVDAALAPVRPGRVAAAMAARKAAPVPLYTLPDPVPVRIPDNERCIFARKLEHGTARCTFRRGVGALCGIHAHHVANPTRIATLTCMGCSKQFERPARNVKAGQNAYCSRDCQTAGREAQLVAARNAITSRNVTIVPVPTEDARYEERRKAVQARAAAHVERARPVTPPSPGRARTPGATAYPVPKASQHMMISPPKTHGPSRAEKIAAETRHRERTAAPPAPLVKPVPSPLAGRPGPTAGGVSKDRADVLASVARTLAW